MAGKNLQVKLAVSLFLMILAAAALPAGTIYVDDDANGLNNGTSWVNAYKYLLDALADANSAQKPVEIRVAVGVYKPDRSSAEPNGTGDRQATFRFVNGVTIKGGYAGFGEPDPNARDITKHETILSGDLAGNDVDVNDPCDLVWEPTRAENSYHVVTGSSTDATAALDGFTITAGNAYDTPWRPMVRNPKNRGGGMYSESGSPTLANCTFRNNSAEEWGGGIFNGWGKDPKPTFTNCTFSRNTAKSKSAWKGGWVGSGGGIYNAGSSPVMTNCTFRDNWAEISAGGIYNGGCNPILSKCIFLGNTAAQGGGGGMINFYSNPIVTDCMFISNRASQGDAGGIGNSEGSPIFTNCEFVSNSASGDGGAMMNGAKGNSILTNCTFSGNSARHEGGGIYNNMNETIVINSVFTGNSATTGGAICCDDEGNIAVQKCTFAGNSATDGNALASNSYRGTWPGKDEISNSIFWDGAGGIWNNDGSEITVSYSNIQGGKNGVYDPCNGVVWGEGNINVDPCFADANNQDFHLKSQAGRYDANEERWTRDEVTSPCIDAGDPASPIGLEPFPNGGIINMGAYGGTAEASKSYFGEPICETIVAGDINGDCIVNLKDFAIIAFHWLEEY